MQRLSGHRLYLDANALIYFGEAHPNLGPLIQWIFELAWQGRATLVAGELSLAEVLVLPFRTNRLDLVTLYQTLIAKTSYFEIVAVNRAVLVESARQRSITGRKLPDSIHVATAVSAGCSMFISEDRDIRVPNGLQLVPISGIHKAP
jgi:predicted nucleic acid-binding protein